RVPSWGRSSVPRFAFTANDVKFKIPGVRWVSFSTRFWVQSGIPFTPRVLGDANGDGLYNDIAFIPNPDDAELPQDVRNGMLALLSDAPGSVKRCLRKQQGRIASRNSCTGPWSGGFDMRIGVSALQRFRLPINITVMNAGGL